jgi:hypothetical protein
MLIPTIAMASGLAVSLTIISRKALSAFVQTLSGYLHG